MLKNTKNYRRENKKTFINARQSIILGLGIVILTLILPLISASEWTESLNVELTTYYDFESGTGTNIVDRVDWTANGTFHNAVAADWVNGIIGNGTQLRNNGNEYINLSEGISKIDNFFGADTAGSYSISFWVYSTAYESNYESIIGRGQVVDGVFNVDITGSPDLASYHKPIGVSRKNGADADADICFFDYAANSTFLNKWTHYVVTFEGRGTANMKLYADNNLIPCISCVNALSSNIDLTGNATEIGGGSNPYNGKIDEIGIWNRILTATEVEQLYNDGSGITYIPTAGIIGVILTSPVNAASLSATGTNFLANYTATNANLTNVTYYLWKSGVEFNTTTVSVSGTVNDSTQYIDAFTLGNYEWNVYACGENLTGTICDWASANYTFSVGASKDNEGYSNITYETSSEKFELNVTLLTGSTLYNAQLIYNNTHHTASINSLGSDKYTITKTIDIPTITKDSDNLSFYWRLTYPLGGGIFTHQNLSSNTQTVNNITLNNCVYGVTNKTLNFTTWNEENNTFIDNHAFYGTFEYWLGSGTQRKNFSFSSTGNETDLCIYPGNLTFYSDATIQYEKTGYIKRSYYLINSTLTNITQEIKLFFLPTGKSTSFILDVTDNVQAAIADAYIYIQRYYPGEGLFHTVEMARTDTSGSTIGHFEAETEDYKIIIFKDGAILYESGVQKIFCRETPCTLTLQVGAGVVSTWSDFGDLPNLIWSLTYNTTTETWTYIYVDTSGTTNWGRLFVYVENPGGAKTIICNLSDYTSAATLTCNTSGYNGTIYAAAYMSRSPEVLVYLKNIMKIALKKIFEMEGLFWAMMILLLLGLIGLWNPTVGILTLIAGMILINVIGLASFGPITIFGVIIIGGIILWEMKS